MAAAQHRLIEDEYDEYTATNNNAAAFCRSIFLIVSISLENNLFRKGALFFLLLCKFVIIERSNLIYAVKSLDLALPGQPDNTERSFACLFLFVVRYVLSFVNVSIATMLILGDS